MQSSENQRLRAIPKVEKLLHAAQAQSWSEPVPRAILLASIRWAVEQCRAQLRDSDAGLQDSGSPSDTGSEDASLETALLARARERADWILGPHYRRAVNATGIILHTGLGRAVLPESAVRQIAEHLSGYTRLQVDLRTGRRSRRDEKVQWLLAQLTGAEAATVVNNNAAATALVLNTVAAGREVIVSRGQLVEIGGSFRLPEVMAASGVRLVEVGTTNKTHPADYVRAITPETAAVMRVHPSNYRIRGFTSEVGLDELVRIAHAHGLVMIDDLGAGALIDPARFGLEAEPLLSDSVAAGADLVTASTDKLVGAAQGGLILGRKPLIDQVRQNPLARVVRIDKLCLAAIEAALTLFLDEPTALKKVPTWAMMLRRPEELRGVADAMAEQLRGRIGDDIAEIATIEGTSQVGSGSLPDVPLPTRLLAVRPHRMSEEQLARALRMHTPPIMARTARDSVLIDPRTLLDGQDACVVDALADALTGRTETP